MTISDDDYAQLKEAYELAADYSRKIHELETSISEERLNELSLELQEDLNKINHLRAHLSKQERHRISHENKKRFFEHHLSALEHANAHHLAHVRHFSMHLIESLELEERLEELRELYREMKQRAYELHEKMLEMQRQQNEQACHNPVPRPYPGSHGTDKDEE